MRLRFIPIINQVLLEISAVVAEATADVTSTKEIGYQLMAAERLPNTSDAQIQLIDMFLWINLLIENINFSREAKKTSYSLRTIASCRNIEFFVRSLRMYKFYM